MKSLFFKNDTFGGLDDPYMRKHVLSPKYDDPSHIWVTYTLKSAISENLDFPRKMDKNRDFPEKALLGIYIP